MVIEKHPKKTFVAAYGEGYFSGDEFVVSEQIENIIKLMISDR